MNKKNIVNLADKTKQNKVAKYQQEKGVALLKWQIENECIIQPVLQPTTDSLKATYIFTEATNEQLNVFKDILNKEENK